jgi:hypothetical protein
MLDLMNQKEPVTKEVWQRVPDFVVEGENLKLLLKYVY